MKNSKLAQVLHGFDEKLHPRDEDGKFTTKEGSLSTQQASIKAANVSLTKVSPFVPHDPDMIAEGVQEGYLKVEASHHWTNDDAESDDYSPGEYRLGLSKELSESITKDEIERAIAVHAIHSNTENKDDFIDIEGTNLIVYSDPDTAEIVSLYTNAEYDAL